MDQGPLSASRILTISAERFLHQHVWARHLTKHKKYWEYQISDFRVSPSEAFTGSYPTAFFMSQLTKGGGMYHKFRIFNIKLFVYWILQGSSTSHMRQPNRIWPHRFAFIFLLQDANLEIWPSFRFPFFYRRRWPEKLFPKPQQSLASISIKQSCSSAPTCTPPTALSLVSKNTKLLLTPQVPFPMEGVEIHPVPALSDNYMYLIIDAAVCSCPRTWWMKALMPDKDSLSFALSYVIVWVLIFHAANPTANPPSLITESGVRLFRSYFF